MTDKLDITREYYHQARVNKGLVLRKETKLSNDPLIINLFGVLSSDK